MHVIATLTCPVGEEVPNMPLVGQTLMICSVQGDPKDWYVMGALPGGINRAIPRNAAGVDMSGAGLAKTQVNMPPKGVGVRYYVRGAAFVIKLKGTLANYKGELFIEADDAADSPDGKTGTFIRIVRDPTTGKMSVKIRDATGANIGCLAGTAYMASPDGNNFIQASDGNVTIKGKDISITADRSLRMDGTILENYGASPAPPIPADAVLKGIDGVSGIPSTAHFIAPGK